MSQPIKLFNADGQEVVMHSPNVAKELVAKGLLFENPPVPAPVKKTTRRRASKKK